MYAPLGAGLIALALCLYFRHDISERFSPDGWQSADLVARPVGADELARSAGPIREQVARASTGTVYWMFLLEGATRDPPVSAAALTIEDGITAVPAEGRGVVGGEKV